MGHFYDHTCSVTDGLEIAGGTVDDLRSLERYHYRDKLRSPHVAIYTIRDSNRGHGFGLCSPVAGVIVYTNPMLHCQMRDVATGGIFRGLSVRDRLEIINTKFKSISRVIIDPRYRGLSLASWLVAETMEAVESEFVESQAIMGHVSGFFERAGMRAFYGKRPERVSRMSEALSIVGIGEDLFFDPGRLHAEIEQLGPRERGFVEDELREFLQPYKRWRSRGHSMERTSKILRGMTPRPVYYLWKNERKAVGRRQ